MLGALWSDLRYRLRALFARSTMDQELDDELHDHLTRQAAANVRAGATIDVAERDARIAIGGVENAKDAIRDAHGVSWLEQLVRDVRYATRTLARTPVFTTAAVLSLGLGIGATTAMFSAFDTLLLRSLPVHAPNELVTFEMAFNDGFHSYNLSYGDFERIQTETDIIASATATSWAESFNVSAERRDVSLSRPAHISVVVGNYFSVVGLSPQVGRLIAASDDGDEMGAHPVVVLSDAYWAREFNRAIDVVGKPLFVNGNQYEVIGVARKGFEGDWIGWPTDFWIPSSMIAQVHPEAEGRPRNRYQFKVIARLQPGTERARAQAAADLLYKQIVRDPPNGSGITSGGKLEVVSAARGYSPQRTSFGQPVTILMVIVATVLLIACANLANLLLARAVARQREIALRLALGAKRSRIVRQLMTESVLLAVLGAALGVLVAAAGMRLLAGLAAAGPAGGIATSANPVSVQMNLHVDMRVLAFTALLCLVTSVLFGLLPALRGSKVALLPALGVGGQRVTGSATPVARAVLVVSQVALSIVLVVATALFVRTLQNLERENLGFERKHLLLAWTLPGHTGRSTDQILPLWEEARARVASLPGVESVAASVEGLLDGGPPSGPLLGVVGRALDDSVRVQQTKTVSPGFFETIRQPLLAGRDFSRFDTDSAPKVAIINESLARRLFPSQAAVGQRIVIRGVDQPIEVIGVVGDAARSPRSARGPAIYYPPAQNLRRLSRGMTLVIRASGDPVDLANSVRQTLNEWNAQLPILNIDTVEEQLDAVLFQERLMTTVSVAFTTLALLLSCVGIYGVVAYITAWRTHEIGIRMALGARGRVVVGSVLSSSLALALVGVVIGVMVSLVTTRAVASVLYGITATDPLSIVGAAALLLVVAAAAGFIPAYRASRVSPMVALRVD